MTPHAKRCESYGSASSRRQSILNASRTRVCGDRSNRRRDRASSNTHRAGVTRRLGRLALGADLRRVSLAEVILELVNHERATDDGVRPRERNLRVFNRKIAPRGARVDVSEIARVSHRIRRRAVIHLVRVKVRSRGHAPVRGVTELVNVQTVLPRSEAGDGTHDFRRAVAVLAQLEHAAHAGGTREHAHRALRPFPRSNARRQSPRTTTARRPVPRVARRPVPRVARRPPRRPPTRARRTFSPALARVTCRPLDRAKRSRLRRSRRARASVPDPPIVIIAIVIAIVIAIITHARASSRCDRSRGRRHDISIASSIARTA